MKIDFEGIKDEFSEKASSFYNDNDKLGELINEFKEKMKDSKIFETVGEDLKLTLDMVNDYIKGDYKDISKESITIIVIGILYILSPMNLMPKIIPLKYLDDVLVLMYVLKRIKDELERYKKWRDDKGTLDIEDQSDYIDIS